MLYFALPKNLSGPTGHDEQKFADVGVPPLIRTCESLRLSDLSDEHDFAGCCLDMPETKNIFGRHALDGSFEAS